MSQAFNEPSSNSLSSSNIFNSPNGREKYFCLHPDSLALSACHDSILTNVSSEEFFGGLRQILFFGGKPRKILKILTIQ
jgi:hypothetical protein